MPTFFEGVPAAGISAQNGLAIYQNSPRATDLVVMVHGWGGTAVRTWGTLPETILGSGLEVDLAIFDYASGLRRRLRYSPDLDQITSSLLTHLNSVQYTRLLFVSHSMGGLITSTAIRKSHEQAREIGKPPVASRTIASLYIASPRAGIRGIPRYVWKDGRFLAARSKLMTSNDKFFVDQVNPHASGGNLARYNVSLWAATADGDRLVTPTSATSGIPSTQVDSFSGNHRSILQNSDLQAWVTRVCRDSLRTPRPSPTRVSNRALRARFVGHPRHGYWEDAFQEALSRFASSQEDIAIVNQTHEPEGRSRTDLHVRVFPTSEPEATARIELLNLADQMDRGSILTLGYSAYGHDADAMIARLSDHIHYRGWLESCATPADLESRILNWLHRTNGVIS